MANCKLEEKNKTGELAAFAPTFLIPSTADRSLHYIEISSPCMNPTLS